MDSRGDPAPPEPRDRGVEPDAVEMVRRVRETGGLPTGELVSDAIRVWYRGLPQLDKQDE